MEYPPPEESALEDLLEESTRVERSPLLFSRGEAKGARGEADAGNEAGEV